MSKITLFTDLDNTMIYSKRRLSDLNNMTCVEYYNGEPLSYMTNNSFSQLQKLSKDSDVQVIPITTRIDYQYERINLPDFKYAILGNGSELRINGVVDEEWKLESEGYRDACIEELEKGFALLRVASKSVRLANDMFVYGKFENTSEVYDILRKCLNLGKVEVFTQGKKVYIFPKNITKGYAIKRLKKYLDLGTVISAGDEVLDFSMADESDLFITSNKSCKAPNRMVSESNIFSDYIFSHINTLNK